MTKSGPVHGRPRQPDERMLAATELWEVGDIRSISGLLPGDPGERVKVLCLLAETALGQAVREADGTVAALPDHILRRIRALLG